MSFSNDILHYSSMGVRAGHVKAQRQIFENWAKENEAHPIRRKLKSPCLTSPRGKKIEETFCTLFSDLKVEPSPHLIVAQVERKHLKVEFTQILLNKDPLLTLNFVLNAKDDVHKYKRLNPACFIALDKDKNFIWREFKELSEISHKEEKALLKFLNYVVQIMESALVRPTFCLDNVIPFDEYYSQVDGTINLNNVLEKISERSWFKSIIFGQQRLLKAIIWIFYKCLFTDPLKDAHRILYLINQSKNEVEHLIQVVTEYQLSAFHKVEKPLRKKGEQILDSLASRNKALKAEPLPRVMSPKLSARASLLLKAKTLNAYSKILEDREKAAATYRERKIYYEAALWHYKEEVLESLTRHLGMSSLMGGREEAIENLLKVLINPHYVVIFNSRSPQEIREAFVECRGTLEECIDLHEKWADSHGNLEKFLPSLDPLPLREKTQRFYEECLFGICLSNVLDNRGKIANTRDLLKEALCDLINRALSFFSLNEEYEARFKSYKNPERVHWEGLFALCKEILMKVKF